MAKEELLYLALQSARIILLRNKITPKTKHDIADQVKPFNKKAAEIVKKILQKEKLNKEKIMDYIKICMEATKR